MSVKGRLPCAGPRRPTDHRGQAAAQRPLDLAAGGHGERPATGSSADRSFYLFTTQRYGQDALTSVYRSTSPLDFGVDEDDGYLVARLPVAAPEIVDHEGRQYIAALLPSLEGIQLAPLEWVGGKGDDPAVNEDTADEAPP